ncbi:unnamed protein product [Cylicostephanus goldi]|uniref:Uncharacterized protein n=1 Tax=Cylicostephanus goldi TaxID=71465 RepID=A0A3P6Q4P8_CYLGO|nr:unnamed protein product [Cylicostephanus goldi]
MFLPGTTLNTILDTITIVTVAVYGGLNPGNLMGGIERGSFSIITLPVESANLVHFILRLSVFKIAEAPGLPPPLMNYQLPKLIPFQNCL